MKTNAVCAGLTLIVLLVAATPAAPVQAQADEPEAKDGDVVECDPYPIGRCGAYQREAVLFCYVLVGGVYTDANDRDAIGIVSAKDNFDLETGVPDADGASFYIRPGPTDTFIGDPMTAPFPFDTLYQESNNIAGLQPEPFKCGIWTWFAECIPQQWMGPTGNINKAPDTLLV